MPYTAITKPSQGDATRKALVDAIIDNQAFFNTLLSVLNSVGIPNGSFEEDGDSDGIPDEWTETLYTGGSFAITGNGLADTENSHGQFAVSFTSPGGAGNGGGYLDTDNFFEVSPERPVHVAWQLKSSVANIRNKIQIRWYTDAQVFISTTTVYSSITNPTAWAQLRASALPPATARFAKLRLVGAEDTTTVAGTAYFDDIRVQQEEFRRVSRFDTPGLGVWRVPDDVTGFVVEVIGAGGGGGGSGGGAGGGGGGGGGGHSVKIYATTPGTEYTMEVGAKGTGGAVGVNGTAGGDSTFDVITAAGGALGTAGGVGGAGGAASGGDTNTNGTAGDNKSAFDGGAGGYSLSGQFGASSTGGDPGGDASGEGGGGGGGSNSGGLDGAGGDGADGLILIRY